MSLISARAFLLGYLHKSAKDAKDKKVSKVMSEYKDGDLHSGSKDGPVVKDRDQAIAIALSEAEDVEKEANVSATTQMTKPTARPRCTDTTCPPDSFASHETNKDPMRLQRPTQKSETMLGESESVQGKQDFKSPDLKFNFTDPEEEEMEKESYTITKWLPKIARDEKVKLTYHESAKLPYRQRSEVFAYDKETNGIASRIKVSKTGSGKYIELPGGGIDKGESPLTAVKREAMEEAGIKLKNIEQVGRCRWKWPKGHQGAMGTWADLYAGDDNYIFIAEVESKHTPTSEEGDGWDKLITLSPEKVREFLKSHKADGLMVMQDCRLAALRKIEARINT